MLERIEKSLLELNGKIAEYEAKYAWIVEERDTFGKQGTKFNFDAMDIP